MNSTDDAALGAYFDTVLMPMAAHMRAEGRLPFPVAPDVTWLSYYVRRKRSTMAPADFGAASCADIEQLEAQLAAHWHELGRHQLAGTVAQLGTAARAARAGRSSGPPSAEVSPYVYAMF
jgi:hypothetical protein